MARSRKAASRQSRKRNQRAAVRPPGPRPLEAGIPSALAAPTTTSSAAVPAATATSRAIPAPAQRGSKVNPRLTVGGPSRLTERAIEEYHYVARDLRNILTLVVVMAVLLAIAFVAFTALGIGHTA